jgi:hypothetical protein
LRAALMLARNHAEEDVLKRKLEACVDERSA